MEHLNQHLLCAVSIKTTGLNNELDEIYEIGCIPVTPDLNRDNDRKWLDLLVRPEIKVIPENHPAKYEVENAMINGNSAVTVEEIFKQWFESQNLGKKKLAILSHSYTFHSAFLKRFFGPLLYSDYFIEAQLRDLHVIGRFLNDLMDVKECDQYPFPKCDLTYMCNMMKVDRQQYKGRQHSAIGDCATYIDLYRAIINMMDKKVF